MIIRLLISLCIVLFSTSVLSAEKEMVTYNYQVTRVIDGDTVAFSAPFLPDPLKKEMSIRVFGVDTPEKGFRAKCEKEANLGQAATDFTKKKIATAKKLQVSILAWDKYGGRVLGDVLIDGASLRKMLIDGGFARPYFGDAKKSWCD